VPRNWGMTPRRSVEGECVRRGRDQVVAGCITLLIGRDGDVDDGLIVALGGPAAEQVLAAARPRGRTHPTTTDSDGRYKSPQAAALAERSTTPGAAPRVVEVRIDGDTATVILETDASNPAYNRDWNHCERDAGGWYVASSNG
jgi:hypothetical protein